MAEPQPTLPPADPGQMLDRFAELVSDYRATVVRCRPHEVPVHVLTALRESERVLVPEGVPDAVHDAVVERLAPVRERALALLDDPAELDRILAAGAEKARAVATPVLEDVYAKVGFLPPLR